MTDVTSQLGPYDSHNGNGDHWTNPLTGAKRSLNELPKYYTQRVPLAAAQKDGRLLPYLHSLLTTPSACLLFSYWLDAQVLGTFHTVELASHLIQITAALPLSITYACELYQTYCTSESPYPVACEIRPDTLERIFSVLEAAQADSNGGDSDSDSSSAANNDPTPPHNLFDALLDELLVFVLPHFLCYLHSSECTYSTIERLLLCKNGTSELMFAVCKAKYMEEMPLFIMDFHAFRARVARLPPRLVAAIKKHELARKKAPPPSASAGHSMQTALEDGFELDNSESSWVVAAKHQRLIDAPPSSADFIDGRELAVMLPRPAIPPRRSVESRVESVHLPSFVAARLEEVHILYEKYLQPSSTTHKNMLHSSLMSLHTRLSSRGLQTGTQMSQPHPAARRAEFAVRNVPYYLLRNYLDHFHLSTKYNFLSSDLLNALHAIAVWCARDLQLRVQALQSFYEAMHFGLGRELGLARGTRGVPYFDVPNLVRIAGTPDERDGIAAHAAAADPLVQTAVPSTRRRARSDGDMAPLADYWDTLPMPVTVAVDQVPTTVPPTLAAAALKFEPSALSSTSNDYAAARSAQVAHPQATKFVPTHTRSHSQSLRSVEYARPPVFSPTLRPISVSNVQLLPALPFVPPQRSLLQTTVAQYRKQVIGQSRLRHKEEEDAEAARAAGLPAKPRPTRRDTLRPEPMRPSSASISMSASPSATTSPSASPAPRRRPTRAFISADDFDLEAPGRAGVAVTQVAPASAANQELALARRQQLHEQMQSMRHILDSPPANGIVVTGTADTIPSHVRDFSDTSMLRPPDTPPSTALAAPSTPSFMALSTAQSPSLLTLSQPPSTAAGSLSANATPRTRAVRFSAHARHEVREFDAEEDLTVPAAASDTLSLPSNGSRPTTPSTPSPQVKHRSILKHAGDHLDHPHRLVSHLSPPIASVTSQSTAVARTQSGQSIDSRAPKLHKTYSDAMRHLYYLRQADIVRLLAILGRGAVFLKYHSTTVTSPHTTASLARSDYRFFYINSEASELCWCKLVNTSKPSELNIVIGAHRKKPQKETLFHKHKTKLLADGLRLFPDSFHSPQFAQYNASGHPPWLCLTLLMTDRSLDLVAVSEQQASDWFFGLQALIPLNPSFKSRMVYWWNRLRLKVQYHAKAKGTTVEKFCRALVDKARKAVAAEQEAARRRRGSATTNTLGPDAAAATRAASKSPPCNC